MKDIHHSALGGSASSARDGGGSGSGSCGSGDGAAGVGGDGDSDSGVGGHGDLVETQNRLTERLSDGPAGRPNV